MRDTEDAMAYGMEEKERMDRLNEQGKCIACGDAPQNPNISGRVCLDCWESHKAIGCQHTGCPNSPDGEFRYAQFCSIHLADRAHKAYESYLKLKSDIDEREQELNARAEDLDIDPRSTSVPPKEWSKDVHSLQDDFISLKLDKQELGVIKSLIESVMDQLDNTFPEEYEIFG